jgi:hypothetical protein
VIVWMRGAGLSPGRQSDRQEDLNPDSTADDHLLDAIQTALERSIAIIRTAHVHDPAIGQIRPYKIGGSADAEDAWSMYHGSAALL